MNLVRVPEPQYRKVYIALVTRCHSNIGIHTYIHTYMQAAIAAYAYIHTYMQAVIKTNFTGERTIVMAIPPTLNCRAAAFEIA